METYLSSKPVTEKRKLLDITLEEAVEVLKLGEGYFEDTLYQLRVREGRDKEFAQLYYEYDDRVVEKKEIEVIVANFGDDENAVNLCKGNDYYRTMYRIVKFLEEQGFDLETANKTR